MKTSTIRLGGLPLGGGAPVRVQSMTNTKTADLNATLKQIEELIVAGCEIVRVTVPDENSAQVLKEIVKATPIPVIADIHFDHRLALAAIDAGVAGLRINPGNIGGDMAVREVAHAAAQHGTVIRVGANAGSVQPSLLREYQTEYPDDPMRAMAETLVESVAQQCSLLEDYGVNQIKVSFKSSHVPTTVLAAEIFSERFNYPQHIGITEAGTPRRGIIKSAVGIGALLFKGIGDTVRVSLTGDPVREVHTAIAILEAAGLREAMPEIVSCPTCGRTDVELEALAEMVENLIDEERALGNPLKLKKIAVMGCAVNGPGEARDADLAICGAADGKVVISKHGKAIAAYPQEKAIEVFRKLLREWGHE